MAAIDDFDPDLIAAFIDGRLSGAERDRVVRLLAESEAAFEVYADALRAKADLEADAPIPFPAPRPTLRPRPFWVKAGVPLAAAAALLIAVLPAVQSRRADAVFAMGADEIAQPLTGQPQLATALSSALDEPRWSVTRGGGSTFVDSTASFRLGVRVTDLGVALGVGDRERAARATAEMAELLASVDLGSTAAVQYRALGKRITDGDSIGSIIDDAAAADSSLGDFLATRWYGVGKWLAAGELAAHTHSADFFKSSKTTRFLDAAIRSGGFAPDEVEALRQVEGAVKRGMPESEFEMVRARLAELIKRHAG